jgi:hypothetical protein
MQHEIDKWTSAASKSASAKRILMDEVDTMLTSNTISKLRELQREISDTNWMFESN